MKFWEIFCFELYYQVRRPATWIYFAAVMALMLLVIGEIADYARTVEAVLLNAPVTVAELTGFANKFGLLFIALMAGDGAMRDRQARINPLYYTSALSKSTYLGARFLGTFSLASVLMLAIVPLSLLLAKHVLGLEPALFGPLLPVAYSNSGLFLSLPNVFIATALLYALVLLSGHAMAAYIGGFLIFLLSTFSMDLARVWELGKLLDPSGNTIVEAYSRSLAPLYINTATVNLAGDLLANRALWLSLAVLAGLVAYSRFRLSHQTTVFWRKRVVAIPAEVAAERHEGGFIIPVAVPSFSFNTRLQQGIALTLRFYREIMLGAGGMAILALGLYAFILIPNLSLGPLDVPIQHSTARVSQFMEHSALQIFVALLITLLAGQLVWRERDTRLHEILDAVPVPDHVIILSKYLALALVLVSLQAVLLLSGVAIQVAGAGQPLELGRFLQEIMGTQLLDQLLFAAVALFLHTLVNQKYIGHLLVLLFYFYTLLAPRIGITHKLLIFGSDLGLSASDLWEQRTFLLPWALFKLYWLGWVLIFLTVARHMWVRGREINFKKRLQGAFRGLRRSPLLLASILLVMVAGSIIFYNTNLLNTYHTVGEQIAQRVAYERLYGQYRAISQPQLCSTKLQVDFYPRDRSAVVTGSYQLKNNSAEPINAIHLAPATGVETSEIRFNRAYHDALKDDGLYYHIYKLDKPLLPGDSLLLSFKIQFHTPGFSNDGIQTAVMEQGSYFRNSDWLPNIGYQDSRELSHARKRREHGLPERQELPSLYDENARKIPAMHGPIEFRATIGTEPGQTAVAPGTLVKAWKKGDRQYFHYVADKPIQNMYHIYSAEYAVKQLSWKGISLQIYHLPKHGLNLDRIAQGMKASLDNYTRNFGAYSHGQLKFVEYPDPGTGGISLPATIGYSSNFALLNAEGDPRGFDLPFAVVAHEVAHQWWGHQLVPAYVEGVYFLSEGLAWYSALGVVEQHYGREHLQKLLDAMRQEYLSPRSRAAVPLLQAKDAFQGYRKGPLAMWALREYVGEDKVNRALQQLLHTFRPGMSPLPTSLDFYAAMKATTPDSLHYLLHDLFAANTFWELETKVATATPTQKGRWQVSLDILANKVQVDSAGTETTQPMDELVEIGIFGVDQHGSRTTLYLQKHKIRTGANRLVVEVATKPEEAGIDPRHLLIDTEMLDNVRKVKKQGSFKEMPASRSL